jgi:hypothetical protein
MFSKQRPILKRTIELIVDNIKNNEYPNNILNMTGPFVNSKAINKIHLELFNETINHKTINQTTDTTYKLNNISYRLYGIDYNECCSFRHDVYDYLYTNKIPLERGT